MGTRGRWPCAVEAMGSTLFASTSNAYINQTSSTLSTTAVKDSFSSLKSLGEFGNLENAIQAAEFMQHRGISISREHAYCLVRESEKLQNLDYGMRIESLMANNGLGSIAALADHLIRLFTSCEDLVKANRSFENVQRPTEYSWTAIITANAKLGQAEMALMLYDGMLRSGIRSSKYVYTVVLQACTAALNLHQGSCIHHHVIESGLEADIYLGSTLVDMYAKCGNLDIACKVFNQLQNRNVVSWNAMVTGYALHNQCCLALECFDNMLELGVKPDQTTFLGTLKACNGIGEIEQGRYMHEQITINSLQSDVFVGSALLDMYAKCGSLGEACNVFENLPTHNVVSWGAMIAAHAQHGEGFRALECFHGMQQQGITPNAITFLSVLKACGTIGAIDQGRQIHKQLTFCGSSFDVMIGSALVDMYAKCGSLEEAHKILVNLAERNVVSWNSMMARYAHSGNLDSVMQCFKDMLHEGIKPDSITFTSILAACSHKGLVDEGCMHIKEMRQNYGILPDASHFNCLADLLSRAGYLNEAKHLLQTSLAHIVGWTTLLSACRTYGNVRLGREIFDSVFQFDPYNASGYVLMSGIYNDSCMWNEAAEIEGLRQCTGAWKKPAKAWIEINKIIHEFVVGD